MDIYIGKESQVLGPYYEDEIQKRLDDGRLDGTELAWHEELDEWVNVKELLEGEDEPTPEAKEPSVETKSAEESEPLDEETLEQVNKIKELIADGHADTVWQLVRSLNNPRIYEALLEDWPRNEGSWYFVPKYLRGSGDLFFKLLGNLPGGKLQQLTKLALGSSHIRDVSPLKDFTQLTRLCLSGTRISDVSPLAELTQLTDLFLGYNQISDVSSLKELTRLTRLDLICNPISDVSSLKELTKLTRLDLMNTQISESDLHELKEALPDCDIRPSSWYYMN